MVVESEIAKLHSAPFLLKHDSVIHHHIPLVHVAGAPQGQGKVR